MKQVKLISSNSIERVEKEVNKFLRTLYEQQIWHENITLHHSTSLGGVSIGSTTIHSVMVEYDFMEGRK